ncbi:MAG: alpha/beta fold hydrolase [Dehalococcoidia bacterium]
MVALATETVGDFRVRVWSEGDGPPLLYLHGFEHHPGDAPFLRRLAQTRRVYAPELPGYGESTGFESIDGILGITLYHRQLVESWGVDTVDVIGHSLGGMLAAEFAAICPHRTRRLVLVDAYGLWLDDAPLPDPFALSEKELAAAKWATPERSQPEPSILIPDPEHPGMITLERMKNLSIATKFMWPIADRGLVRRLPYIQAPTLIVHGAADGLIPPAYAEEFARLIPNARVQPIDQAGHLPMVEREDTFISAVEQFLAE